MSGKDTRDRLELTVAIQDLIAALKKMDPEEREDLSSVEEARQDWREGRVKSHEQLFKSAD